MTTPAQTSEPTRAELEQTAWDARTDACRAAGKLVNHSSRQEAMAEHDAALGRLQAAERALGRLEGREAAWSEVRKAPAVKRWNPAESGFEYTYLEADCPWFLADEEALRQPDPAPTAEEIERAIVPPSSRLGVEEAGRA